MAVGAILQLSWFTQILVAFFVLSSTSRTTSPQWISSPYTNNRFFHDNGPETCSISRLNFPTFPTFCAANSPLGPPPVRSQIPVSTTPVMAYNNTTSICQRMPFALHHQLRLQNIEQLVKAAAAAPPHIQLAPSTLTLLKLDLRPAAPRSDSGISPSRSLRERFRDLKDSVKLYVPWLTMAQVQIIGTIFSFFFVYAITRAIFTVCRLSFTSPRSLADFHRPALRHLTTRGCDLSRTSYLIA